MKVTEVLVRRQYKDQVWFEIGPITTESIREQLSIGQQESPRSKISKGVIYSRVAIKRSIA